MPGLLPRNKLLIRISAVSILCLSAVFNAAGQHNPYEFFSGGISGTEEVFQYPAPETDIFYTPENFPDDVFTAMSEFNFSYIKYSRRGYGRTFDKTYFGDIAITDRLTSSPDYSAYYNLKRTRLPGHVSAGGNPYGNRLGLPGETKEVAADISTLRPANTASVFASDRRGRWGGRLSSSGSIKDKWYYTANVYRRWGKDRSFDGVFTDETSFLAGIQRNFKGGHSVSLSGLGSKAENGMRSYAAREAFELTGDKYYNPSWGYFNGKIRNAKVSERFQPVILLNYTGRLSEKTSLSATVSHRTGESSYTALAWFDAATPYPDYYRYMPSYAGGLVSEILAEQWKSGDRSVTQIDWDKLYGINRMNGKRSVYTIEERVEKANDSQAGITFRTNAGDGIDIRYGVLCRRDDTRFFKRMKDLLGGMPVDDTDQYLYEDEIFVDMTANNVRDPYRKINEGDIFGYDYRMDGRRAEMFGTVCYTARKFMVSGGFDFAKNSLRRNGRYEKENYPGALSFGKSDKFTCESYTVSLSAGYTITPKHRISATAMTAVLPPSYGNIFLSPNYANKMTEDPETYRLSSAQLSYGMTSGIFMLNLSGYYTATSGESAVYNYYDDIAHMYSDMALSDISKEYYGAELGAKIDISPRFSISAAAFWGRNKYSGNPDVTIYEDATFSPYVTGAKTYLKGYKLGGSPESAGSIELSYNAMGWLASLTYSYAGGRYITPNPARRMSRAYNLASSPERFSEFVEQEKLPGAGSAGLFVMRTFRISQTSMSLMLSVNNILNDKNTIYNGYEQMRIMKRGSGVNVSHMPFPSKYLYAYGRNYYVSMIWRF